MKYTRKQLEKLTTKELMKIRNDLKQDFKQSEKVDKRIMSRFDETTISNNELNSYKFNQQIARVVYKTLYELKKFVKRNIQFLQFY